MFMNVFMTESILHKFVYVLLTGKSKGGVSYEQTEKNYQQQKKGK
jgi:hypothetical protein